MQKSFAAQNLGEGGGRAPLAHPPKSVAEKGYSLRVIAGTLAHTGCKRKYTRPEKSYVALKADSAKQLPRFSTGGFYFRLSNCFLCARFVNDREK